MDKLSNIKWKNSLDGISIKYLRLNESLKYCSIQVNKPLKCLSSMQSLNDISTWNGMDMLGYIRLFLNVQLMAAIIGYSIKK